MTLCIQIELLFYNAFSCETVTRKWRWLHPGQGGTCPHFYKWLDTGAPRVRRIKNKKVIKLQWPHGNDTKTTDCTCKAKKWRARQNIYRRFAPDMCLPPLNFWCFWYDELLEQFSEHLWQTVPHRSRHYRYVERVFSVCGLLTAGRRNRMTKSLQMRACLKLNKKVLANTGINASVWTLEL